MCRSLSGGHGFPFRSQGRLSRSAGHVSRPGVRAAPAPAFQPGADRDPGIAVSAHLPDHATGCGLARTGKGRHARSLDFSLGSHQVSEALGGAPKGRFAKRPTCCGTAWAEASRPAPWPFALQRGGGALRTARTRSSPWAGVAGGGPFTYVLRGSCRERRPAPARDTAVPVEYIMASRLFTA